MSNETAQSVFDQIVQQTKYEQSKAGGLDAGIKAAMNYGNAPTPKEERAAIQPEPPKKRVVKRATSTDIAISAYEMKLLAEKNHNAALDAHIMAINEKIKSAAERGSLSTNIVFQVIPSEVYIVQNLVDWYNTRGFSVFASDPNPTRNAVTYTIQLSWREPKDEPQVQTCKCHEKKSGGKGCGCKSEEKGETANG